MKILIVQTAFIGDLILTTPLIRAAKQIAPQTHISVLAIPQSSEILSGNPDIDELLLYDKRGKDKGIFGFLRLLKALRKEQFDIALIPHRSFRSATLAYLSRISKRVGFDKSAGNLLLTEKAIYRHNVHEVERNLDLLRSFGLDIVDKHPRIFLDEKSRMFAEEFLAEEGVNRSDTLVALAPGSIWPTKRWISEGYAEISRSLILEDGVVVVLIGGPDDVRLCREIIEKAGERILSVAGKARLMESAAIIERCHLLVSNDSAPAHIASALGIPTVAIFGPTIPAFGFAPYGFEDLVVQKSLYCRPCGIHGGSKCPEDHFRCMREITPDDVLRGVRGILTQPVSHFRPSITR